MPNRNHRLLFLALLLSLIIFQCRRSTSLPYQSQKNAIADSAMVVTPHPLASEVGRSVLGQGGNAVDAAVAVQLALAVVFPRAGNIGGGGFMVYRSAEGAYAALDYREKAPRGAGRDMYLDSLGQLVEGLSTAGHLAAGVPGTVDGLLRAHERYGRLSWATLVEPAIELAKSGFRISEAEAARLNRYQEAFREYNRPEQCPVIKDDWQAGDRLVQNDLAQTLTRIRDRGRAGFYAGKTADLIAAEMAANGGLITAQDLADYQARWREPIVGQYKDFRIISMPPPSSGGIALVQMLNMVEPYPLAEYGFHSREAVHLMVEAQRRAFADRAAYLGDSDFYEVPRDSLLSESYLTERMADFSGDTATVSENMLAGDFQLEKEHFETTHTSVVDAEGNAVSLTTTLNSNYGCKVMVDGAGFFLNNEMDDFSAKPGVPNQFGLIGAEANAIAPGKRMLSSMTPTIVEEDGELLLVLGAPGGSTIITAVFQVILNIIEFEQDLETAVRAGRFHHQWLPDQIRVEEAAVDTAVRQALAAMGHEFKPVRSMAVVKAIRRLPDGRLQGAADPRNPDDDARGF